MDKLLHKGQYTFTIFPTITSMTALGLFCFINAIGGKKPFMLSFIFLIINVGEYLSTLGANFFILSSRFFSWSNIRLIKDRLTGKKNPQI